MHRALVEISDANACVSCCSSDSGVVIVGDEELSTPDGKEPQPDSAKKKDSVEKGERLDIPKTQLVIPKTPTDEGVGIVKDEKLSTIVEKEAQPDSSKKKDSDEEGERLDIPKIPFVIPKPRSDERSKEY